MENNIRYIAKVLIEATTTMAVNSGDRSLLLDNQISRDANGLPYIPGTSITGIIRDAFKVDVDSIFGTSGEYGQGSRLIISSAHVLGDDGKKIIDGLTNFDRSNDYYQKLMLLPQRDHVKINDRGTAVKSGKFDRELVFSGTRFCFEIELIGNESDKASFEELLSLLNQHWLRIGSGTRKGSGSFKVLQDKSKYWILDLNNEAMLKAYMEKSSNLNGIIALQSELWPSNKQEEEEWEEIEISLYPEDFFLFGSGLSDDEADNTPKQETVIEWKNSQPSFENKYLIPATSIKGAISHRTAYHYNLENNFHVGTQKGLQAEDFDWNPEEALAQLELTNTSGWSSNDTLWAEERQRIEQYDFDTFLDESQEWQNFEDKSTKYGGHFLENPTGENNEAVAQLFGEALESKQDKGRIGNVIIDDVYIDPRYVKDKVFNHVKIDRFTGGSYKGALFQEKVITSDIAITIKMYIRKNIDLACRKALDMALEDLKSGALPLGGGTAKGYGTFTTKLK